MTVSPELIRILVCPACKGELEYVTEPESFVCHHCRLRYPVKDDIPVMLIDEAVRLEGDDTTNHAG